MKTPLRHFRFAAFRCVAFTALALVFASASYARNPLKIGVPALLALPGGSIVAPTIDGSADGDIGWNGAFRYEFGNATPAHDAVFQVNCDASNLYFSFEVDYSTKYDPNDLVLIGLDPTGNEADVRRFVVFPVDTAQAAGTNQAPHALKFFTGHSGGTTFVPPAGSFDAKVTTLGSGHWFVEVRLSRGTYHIPAAADFGLYVDIIPVQTKDASITASFAGEYVWPRKDTNVMFGDYTTGTPALTEWGTASVGGTSNGVSFAYNDISTDANSPDEIKLPGAAYGTSPATTFSVNLHNASRDATTNALIAANRITATFKIANFGLPSGPDWSPVPTGSNPKPAPGDNVGAGSTAVISTAPWAWASIPDSVSGNPASPTPKSKEWYLINYHQCILVELHSDDVATAFSNDTAGRNMNFGTASTFSSRATISSHGYGAPANGSTHRFNLQIVERDLGTSGDLEGKPTASASENRRTSARYQWIAKGYLTLGKNIIINGTSYEVVKDVGAFGYDLRHEQANPSWVPQFTGPGLEQVAKNFYQINLAPDTTVDVNTTITAIDGPVGPVVKNCCASMSTKATASSALMLGVIGLFVFVPRRKNGK